ncbi:hypothetical protein D3C72_1979670 [compost metagenome]
MAQQHALQRLAVFHGKPAGLAVQGHLHETRHPCQYGGRAVAAPVCRQGTLIQQAAGDRELALLLVAAPPGNPHHAAQRIMDGQCRICIGIVDELSTPFDGMEPADLHGMTHDCLP